MNELTPTKKVRSVGATNKDSAMLRGLCSSLNMGFTAPGGADANTQKEITEAMRGHSTFKQPTLPAPTNIPAQGSALKPVPREGQGATLPPTALPTQEAVREVVRRPDIPVATRRVTEPEDLTDATVPLAETEPAPAPPEPERPAAPAYDGVPNPRYRKVVFTGQMKAGKDYCAEAAGYSILSLADPLYKLLEFFFGVTEEEKDLPGARNFMQLVGTWGRGDISVREPLSPERAVFVRMIQIMGATEGVLPMDDVVDWQEFGKNQNIWLDACMRRADALLESDERAKVAVVNGRFANEIKAFDAAGWARFHVMASPLALKQRREQDNVPSAALQHSSEAMAVGLDKGSITAAQRTKNDKINVIWNDPKGGRPSSKFYTLAEFVSTVNTPE